MEGRIEVKHDSKWGTICQNGCTVKNANVVCKMLGFQKALVSKSFGNGRGKIWLDDVSCMGNEESIDKCCHPGWGNHNCNHDQDVGVICLPNGKVCILKMVLTIYKLIVTKHD